MLYETTSEDVLVKDYPISLASTLSSGRKEPDVSEILDSVIVHLAEREFFQAFFFYRSFQRAFEIDMSSVHPLFEATTETYIAEALSEEDIVDEMLEHDFVVKMSPVKEYTVRTRIRSVTKGTPRIVEPESS